MLKKLIIVDGDTPFRERLGRSMEKKGFFVETFASYENCLQRCFEENFDYAVIDMRLEDGSGLELIKKLKKISPKTKSLLLTGYGNIATAVAAVIIGATDYLAKPADANDITNALLANTGERPPPPDNPMSADRVRWEHIQRVFELCNRNVSETARRLNMHRRTLQRILAKRSPR